MNKKAQGMPVNVIIIAIIALVVLVVLIAIFTGRIGLFGKQLNECVGTCEKASDTCPEGQTKVSGKWYETGSSRQIKAGMSQEQIDQYACKVCCIAA